MLKEKLNFKENNEDGKKDYLRDRETKNYVQMISEKMLYIYRKGRLELKLKVKVRFTWRNFLKCWQWDGEIKNKSNQKQKKKKKRSENKTERKSNNVL